MASKQQTQKENFKLEQEHIKAESEINDKGFLGQTDKLIVEEETCPHCNRTQYQCDKETELEKNPITYWMDGNWGLSCDECWYAAHPESDKSEDDDDTD
jgi:hypothetical protein